MPSPWVALPAGTDVRAVARQVSAARDGFLSTGRLDAGLRAMVAESWRRCRERGADPQGAPLPDLADTEFAAYREAHPLAGVLPVVRRLLVEDAADAGVLVALTDAGGRLLWVEGASGPRRRAETFGFVEGALWSEDAAGTNAPGTALALDHPVQIFAAEHLADQVTAWSCSAAPIHAPDGTLLGAIDLTGGHEVAAPHNLTLVRTAAAAVEAELRLRHLHVPPRPRPAPPQPRPGPVPAAPPGPPRLELLGRPTGELALAGRSTPLRLRHAEILLLLAQHPAGLTSEQLAVALHERPTAPVTLRAELSRLREELARLGAGVELGSRPYRLLGAVDSDVAQVRRLLQRGAYRRALAAYPGPLLPASTAPGIEAARDRLRHELRGCLLAGRDADLLWTFAQSPEGADDLEIWEACHRALPVASRRLPVVRARVRQLHAEYA
jgi:GAF domain